MLRRPPALRRTIPACTAGAAVAAAVVPTRSFVCAAILCLPEDIRKLTTYFLACVRAKAFNRSVMR